MSLKDNLRTLRERAGYTNAKDFAQNILKIPYSSYLGYETKGIWPNEETLCRIASALHVTIDELLGYKPNEISRCIALLKQAGFTATYDEKKDVAPVIFNLAEILKMTLKTPLPGEEDEPLTPIESFEQAVNFKPEKLVEFVSNAEKNVKEEMGKQFTFSFKKQIYLTFYCLLNNGLEKYLSERSTNHE